MSDKADFAELEKLALPLQAKGRTQSAALLIWFLQTVYRLEEIEAQDAVCDRKHDEGVDAIVVNDSRREIVLFQCKRAEKLPSTLGDTELKKFVGSLVNFKNKTAVETLVKKTKNPELAALLTKLEVSEKIKAGFKVRPIFVANVAENDDAKKYIASAKQAGHSIELWDLQRLAPVLRQLSREWFVDQKVKIPVDASKLFVLGPKGKPKLVYAAISAKELVSLPGIDDLRIFAQNVRLGLGNTRVNNEIIESLKNKNEHADFITFHNGLTIVSKTLSIDGGELSLESFSVCNGCQSLLSMWESKSKLTDSLEVLVRIVKIGDDRRIPELIAYRTNNQNAISLRDLNSNDSTQVHLKNSFDQTFGNFSTYVIKRGEAAASEELPNELAGRLILALIVEEPWSAHQKFRIFGDLETRIFDFDLRAEHIRLAQLIDKSVEKAAAKLKNERMAKYGLTKFILIDLVGKVLRVSGDGRKLLASPTPYLSTNAGLNPREKKLIDSIDVLARYVVRELDYYAKENGGDQYDYKRSFKSQTDVQKICTEVLKAFEKDIDIGRAEKFKLPN